MGVYYNEKGDFVSATELALEALSIAEKREDMNKQAQILTNLGILYGKQKNYQNARKYLLIAKGIVLEMNDNRGLTYIYSNLAIIYSNQGNLDSALYYNLESLEMHKRAGDIRGAASILVTTGSIYDKKGQHQKALDCYTEGLALCDSAGLIRQKTSYFLNKGALLLELKQFSQSENNYQQALSISKEMGYKTMTRSAYIGLADLNKARGNMGKAYDYLELYIEANDSIMNESNQRAIVEMQTRFDTEKIEKENEILTQEAEIQSLELKRQQTRFWVFAGGIGFIILLAILAFILYRLRQRNIRTQLEKQSLENEQRMLRSQMNPHFIFNSMNSIQSYISGNDNNTAMSYLSKFARLMRGILENSRKSMIPLEDEVETLNLYIELERLRFKNKFEFKMELDQGLDQEGMYVPPMLIQPFVENAIKHGLVNKGGDGLLKLSFTKEDKLIRCIVEDNGIGRDQAGLSKNKQSSGHRSLGMQVTRERMDAIKKELNIDCDFKIIDLKDENGQACGTRVEILIPFEEE
jgi:tetratricopeptide (TPR) repeat protein